RYRYPARLTVGLLPLDVAGSVACVLLGVPLLLSALRSALLVSRLAVGLLVARILAAGLPRVPGVLPIVPPFLTLSLRARRCQWRQASRGESENQDDHANPSCALHDLRSLRFLIRAQRIGVS